MKDFKMVLFLFVWIFATIGASVCGFNSKEAFYIVMGILNMGINFTVIGFKFKELMN